MTEDHNTLFRDNLAAYALGALDSDEKRRLEEHLETCVECQAELADYTAVSEGLLSALPPQAPPAALRKQLAAHLPQTDQPGQRRLVWPFGGFSFSQVATAVVVLLLLASNLFSALQVRGLQHQQAELAQRLQTEQSAIAMLAYPGTESLPISEGVAGSLLVNKETNTAVLFTWNLDELPENETYQIWLIDEQGNRASGGLFVAQSQQAYTSTNVALPAPLTNFVGLGVTIEPRGGSSGPTGRNVLKVSF